MTYYLLLPCLSELAVEACSGSSSAVDEVGGVLPEWVEHFRWNAFSRPFDAPSEGVAQSICLGQPKRKKKLFNLILISTLGFVLNSRRYSLIFHLWYRRNHPSVDYRFLT